MSLKYKVLFLFSTHLLLSLIVLSPFINDIRGMTISYFSQKLESIYTIKRLYLTYTGTLSTPLYTPSHIRKLVSDQCLKRSYHPSICLALVDQESNFNSQAISSAGALGLTQVMPEWQGHTLCPSFTSTISMLIPESNLDCGFNIFFHHLHDRGSIIEALKDFHGSPRCSLNPDCNKKLSIYVNSYLLKLLNHLTSYNTKKTPK